MKRLLNLSSYESKAIWLIALLFFLRLFHITNPPIEVSHNWRQTTSLMVARNYYQTDNNILYPTIDECGEKRGVIGMELPALPYSIYLAAKIFGYDHWYGRLINLFVVSIGSWFFFLLISAFFGKEVGFYATIAYVFSAIFHLARKVLPDPMSLSLVIIGVYYGLMFLKVGGWWRCLLYLLFASLGTLVKIPFGLFLVVLAFPFFDKNNPRNRKVLFALASIPVLISVYWWYFVWNMHLSETFGQWYNSGRSLSVGAKELMEHFPNVLEKFYFSAFHSYGFFIMAIIGLFFVFKNKNKKIIWALIALAPLMLLYMMKSGFLFSHHGYYALVVMPLMALLVVNALLQIPLKLRIFLLTLVIIESVANQQHDFFIKEREFVKMQLTEIADQVSTPTDLVALASNENPNEFYFLNRKGWLVMSQNLNEIYLLGLKAKGCRFFFARKGKYEIEVPFEVAFENKDYIVFKL